MIVIGKHLNPVAEMMQRDLRKIDTWCESKGFSVNPEKTEVELFTKRRKEVVRLEYISRSETGPDEGG